MKEVFEKIVEILENKAHEAEKDMELSDNYADAQAFGGKKEGYENAIEIVNRAAAEYNNGWISCSERFPKVEDLHEKSVDDCTCYLIQRRGGIMDVAHYIKVYGEPYFEANSIKMKDVVAWMPLPEQYKPKFVQKCVNASSNEEIEELNKKIRSIPVCTYPTNADRIRSMSDEELAKFLIHVETLGYNDSSVSGKLEMIEWLQSEVE